jgi:hypothetical protein
MEISIIKQIADTEIHIPDKQTQHCCIHRLTLIQTHLHEQALLLQGYPQGEAYQNALPFSTLQSR